MEEDYATDQTRSHAPLDLDHVAGELATEVEKAMVAMHDLQTALINLSSKQKRASIILDQFPQKRENMSALWDRTINFLELCCGYGEDYIFLCEFALNGRTSKEPNFLDVIGKKGADVLAKSVALKTDHTAALKDMQDYKRQITPLFLRSVSLKVALVTLQGKVGGKRRAHTVDATMDQFIQAAESSLHPDGRQSLKAIGSAVDGIGTALNDLVTFWKAHVERTTSSTRESARSIAMSRDLRQEGEVWKRYRNSLLASISSISRSADAVKVNALGDTVRTADSGPVPPTLSIWQRFLQFFSLRK